MNLDIGRAPFQTGVPVPPAGPMDNDSLFQKPQDQNKDLPQGRQSRLSQFNASQQANRQRIIENIKSEGNHVNANRTGIKRMPNLMGANQNKS